MKIIINIFIAIAVIAVLFALYYTLCIRVVNYDIGGVKIPSRYNIISGKAMPIKDYKGTANLPTVESQKTGLAGLSEAQASGAQIRWAFFTEWGKTKPEYNGWESDPALFAKAQEDFKNNIESRTKVVVVK